MKLIRVSVLFLLAAVILTACDNVSYKKTPGGMPYKMFRGKGSKTAKEGEILKLSLTQTIKDSVYFTTEGKLPFYMPVPAESMANKYDISELWTKLRKGDSVIATQLMDTFIKRNPGNVPPEFKNGDKIITKITVLDIFSSDSLARVDEEKGKAAWLTGEIATVQKYLADKKITAQKTKSGAFVEIIKPGEGNLIDSGKVASVNYTGTTFAGVKFDSNVDTAFHHSEVMSFQVNTGQMIKGFDEAMNFLRLGAEARIYIPSMLAYGGRPNSPLIKPFEHLIFDIKVMNVKTQEEARPLQQAPGQKVDVTQPKK